MTFESDRGPTLPSYVHLYEGGARWSPDGSMIAFFSNRDAPPADPQLDNYTLYIMDYPTRNTRRLIFNQLASFTSATCSNIGYFDWSPDGSRFVLSVASGGDSCQGPFSSNLYVANLDGSGLVRLTRDLDILNFGPIWSPDGNQIAFVSQYQDGQSAIDVINADGSNRRRILTNENVSVAWSPDGSKILSAYGGQLYTIKPDGSDLRQLTNYPADHQYPRWSPDGTKIVFVRKGNGSVMYVMNADGTDEHDVSNDPPGNIYNDWGIDWQPLFAPANDPPPSVLGLNAGLYVAQYPTPPNIDIVVMRGGNLEQTVSCDYQIRLGNVTSGLPSGSLSFAPGETSKTIQLISSYFSSPENISLFNNVGNATFVGGIRDATIILADRGTNPIDFSAFFVRQQYYDFLNREPDKSGWDYWTNNMDCPQGSTGPVCRDIKAAKRIDTSAAFFLSIEFQQTGYLVYRTYKAAYGNLLGAPVPIRLSEFLPDTQQIGQGVIVGQSGWEQALESNKQNFMTSFVQRPRFTSAYPTAMTVQQFVDALYTNAGLVPTSAPNRPKAISEFNSTTPSDPAARARALRDVAEDPMLTQQEFNRAFVLMQYFGYLRRNPNDTPDSDFTGYNFWLGKLNTFNGDYNAAEMVKAFIVSSEYRQRFGP